MPSCHSVHDLELAVQDLWAHLPQDIMKVSNQLNAGPCGGMYCSWRRQINLEVDNDDVQELLDSHNQELTVNELIEMHEQQQGIEGL
ncbi:hypothetical protein TNCV_557801 [Trichonephila clavipes]|nr:hypothetical protein TNCV_557801 [Trichonephila clavipes]